MNNLNLTEINERLDYLESYIRYFVHCKINNASGGNMHTLTFDQWLYSKHLDHLLTDDAMIIPLITDELGKYWDQPDNRNIYITDKKAFITEVDFEKLKNYSHSQPSGVYVGKMWKGQYQQGAWYLAWYGRDNEPGYCSNNYRYVEILPKRNYTYELDEKHTLTIF